MEKIVSLCKRRGFIFQSSEIYGGINGFWDYGPLGAQLKRNVKDLWWRAMALRRDDIAGLEATIIMAPKIWKASGHVDTFADLMVECPITKKRFRADQVEKQSGFAFHFSGAVCADAVDPEPSRASARERESSKPIAVLVKNRNHRPMAMDRARQFYLLQGITNPALKGEKVEEVTDSRRFNPENGVLLTEPRPFNLMFKTFVGPVESEDHVAYLRPETAQAIFAQFKNVLESSRQKVPFGIAQIGKAFRNEVTPRNFTFRSREFEQMELEYFIKPDEAVEAICGSVARPDSKNPAAEPRPDWGWQLWHQYWVEERFKFYESIGLPRTMLEEYWQKTEELAHYARATVDILYKFPFGAQELEGVAARSDFDLSQHQRFSGKPMAVFDEELKAAWQKLPGEKQDALWRRYYGNRKEYLAKMARPEETPEQIDQQAREDADALARGQYIPHVIEPSAGVDRLILALICNAYTEDQAPDEKGKMEIRTVLKFHPRVAPIKAAVFPLLKNKPDLVSRAKAVRDLLRPHLPVFYDEAGAIGRRYRRQDEIGTPFCLTIDFETLGEKGEALKDTVTLRDRDTMKQERVKISELLPFLLSKVS
ncbi:MAG: glycine--tRNA ligase [Limisphaerales bacterium]